MMRKICILVPLLLLLLLPLCGSDLRAPPKYYSDSKTWNDAQAFCRKTHSDLVTIKDGTENQCCVEGWIGLYREDINSKWKWSRGDEIANFTNWKDGEPKDDEHCAFTDKTEWKSEKCHNTHHYTCNDEKLVLVKTKKTWEEALMHCRALKALDPSRPANSYQNNRYDLATLLTDDDLAFAQEKAQESDHEVWTGLRFLAGQWMWVGGEAVQRRDIRSCPQGQDFCGTQWKGTLGAKDCKQERYFLCYRKL